jgi:hypothetical protein
MKLANETAARLSSELQQSSREKAALRAENESLREELEQMRAAAAAKPTVRIERNAAWIGAGHDRQSGPYCATCWGKESKLIPLSVSPNRAGRRPAGRCGSCSNSVWLVDETLREESHESPGQRLGHAFDEWNPHDAI